MAVDDAATGPARIALEIHRQLGDIAGAVPIHDIARALDIETIEARSLNGFEGVLITEQHRDLGVICVNSRSSPQRQRYSVAHELGHFLCQWHQQNDTGGFRCSRQDMAMPMGDEIHRRQEGEANLFAIELLAPRRLVLPFLRRLPDLEHVVGLHKRLDISRTAAARRYVALHGQRLAVVFARDGAFQYVDRGEGFPYLPFNRNEPLPHLPLAGRDSAMSEMVEADPDAWMGLQKTAAELFVQVLRQEDNRATILLHLPEPEDV